MVIKKYKKYVESILVPHNLDERTKKLKEELDNLFHDNLSWNFVRTDMGSGWRIKLFSPYHGEYVEKKLYIDSYEGDDDPLEYQNWKDELLEISIEDFKDEYKEKWIHYFQEYLQFDED